MKEAMLAGLIGGVSQAYIRVSGESTILTPFLARISRVSLFKVLPFLDRLTSCSGTATTAYPALRVSKAV